MTDRYKVICRIGEGTFGEVHKARDVVTGELRALKRVRLRNLESATGFPNTALREMRALQELDHPNIIKLHTILPQGSSVVFVFDYMRGDLSHVLAADEPLQESHVKCYMHMLLQGLTYCHANSIIHRDLKPSNLLISTGGILKIADFGLARVHVPTANEAIQPCCDKSLRVIPGF